MTLRLRTTGLEGLDHPERDQRSHPRTFQTEEFKRVKTLHQRAGRKPPALLGSIWTGRSLSVFTTTLGEGCCAMWLPTDLNFAFKLDV